MLQLIRFEPWQNYLCKVTNFNEKPLTLHTVQIITQLVFHQYLLYMMRHIETQVLLKTVYLYIADSLIEWHGDQMQGISDALNFHLIHCGFFHHSHLKQHEVNNYWALQSTSLTNYPFENPACESFSDGALLKNWEIFVQRKGTTLFGHRDLLLFPWLHLLTISVFFSRW